jgi:sec-independent protein translocase protein TatB
MFDFSFGELAVIGTVALVVLGPERLPKVARAVGDWVGKAQRYVSQVKSDINREIELSELKKVQEEARTAAQSMKDAMQGAEASLTKTAEELNAAVESTSESASPGANLWETTDNSWERQIFPKRYKPGPSVDELAEEVARLKREMALPDSYTGTRRKYAPRGRSNRPRIRR